jgi:hypothetical protein
MRALGVPMRSVLDTDRICWGAALNRGDIEFEIGPAAQDEVRRFIASVPADMAVTDVDRGTIASTPFDHLTCDLERIRERVERDHRCVVVRPVPELDFRGRRLFAWVAAAILGDPVPQNTAGDRLMPVYARPGVTRIADGARYHQTREGGASHTDNVSLPALFDYLVFSCIRPAALGGESILISAFSVHEELRAVPVALDILRRPFWWEYRGISADLFQAPIVTYSGNGEPRFRYLRRYLESAHTRAGEPLTTEQIWALDALDAILDFSTLRFRLAMAEGEILIAYDSQVLHARTTFCDRLPGAPTDACAAAAGPWRYFDRVWVTKRSTGAPQA